MNILMLSNEFPPTLGGVQTHVYELSRALVSQGHTVTVMTRHHHHEWPVQEALEGISIIRLGLSNSHWLYNWQLRRAIKTLHQKQQIDVIHVHGMRPLDATRNLNIPVIFTNHTSGFLRRIQQGDKVLRKMRIQLAHCAMILAPSEELVDATVSTGYRGPCRFIANGVDSTRFSPGQSPLRQALGIPDKAIVAVLARRLVAKNGVLYLAEALKQIHHPDFHLIVAGDGADRPSFEALIHEAPCAARVHLLGGVDNARMPDIFRAANIAILPSLMEATSIAGLEAMASGLALVGTRVGGIPVIVEENRTGLLVPAKDPAALADAINQLLLAPERVDEMGKNAILKVQKEFSWQRIAEKTVAAYQQALTS